MSLKILFLSILSFMILIAPARADIVTGLLGWWKLDGNVQDYSGNVNNGTAVGVTNTTDRFNKANMAMVFNGVDQYIYGSGISIANSPFTIAAWIKTSYTANEIYFSIGSVKSVNDATVHLRITSNTTMRFGMWGDDLNVTLSNISNNWTFLVTTMDSIKVQRVYCNAVEVGTRTANSFFIGNADWKIGAWTPEFFDGAIDDVRIYNRALTATDVAELYNNGGPTGLKNGTIRNAVIR